MYSQRRVKPPQKPKVKLNPSKLPTPVTDKGNVSISIEIHSECISNLFVFCRYSQSSPANIHYSQRMILLQTKAWGKRDEGILFVPELIDQRCQSKLHENWNGISFTLVPSGEISRPKAFKDPHSIDDHADFGLFAGLV